MLVTLNNKVGAHMEAIADLMHVHANQNNPIPPANEGDHDVFMVLAYCVA